MNIIINIRKTVTKTIKSEELTGINKIWCSGVKLDIVQNINNNNIVINVWETHSWERNVCVYKNSGALYIDKTHWPPENVHKIWYEKDS